MKASILAFFISLAASMAGQPEVLPVGRYVVGLTPFLEKSAKDDVYRRLVGVVLEQLPLKASLSFFDAYNLTNIAQIDIPDARVFESGKTRANQFRDPVLRLRQFLANEPTRPASNPPGFPFNNAIRLPQFMDFVADNLVADPRPLTVILIGSPLHVDPKEPVFSMIDGYFPSDGHLLAGRDQTIYGARTRPEALRNVIVHLGYVGDPWVSAIHQDKITRFWALYLSRQGGRLGAFCGDLTTLFQAIRTPSPAREFPPVDPSQTKIEMLRIHRDLNVADWITRETLSGSKPPPPSRKVGPMKIGIRWKGAVDLDLYAAANSGSDTLFFEQTRTREGYYYKDHRSSPDREYEFVEFEAPVDVNQVQAYVNFYKGESASGPNGEVRIEFDGKIYSGSFRIDSKRGNKGRSGSSQAAYWARMDVPAILGLTTTDR